jgi:hypothetical protein
MKEDVFYKELNATDRAYNTKYLVQAFTSDFEFKIFGETPTMDFRPCPVSELSNISPVTKITISQVKEI